ncbi:DUF2515 family protein [Paenibacillus solisilvae]|uniref:DUF2515 family protein n=1 Tax=Paenibacillus solisilvae TaxID=2486751 RepID=A0ABW0W5T3_9BACL
MEWKSGRGHAVLKLLAGGIRMMMRIPPQLFQLAASKRRSRQASHRLSLTANLLTLRKEFVEELVTEWSAQSNTAADAPSSRKEEAERALIYRIQIETEQANRNNVTRTEAYRAVYFRCPELHWALLAHVVSRNGGWNMTDLKGELLPRLLTEEERSRIFELLERINALIFYDAYPQLLLYEAGKRAGLDLSDLLPVFGVSRFMKPVWTHFWQRGDSALLTTALIVNEQNVIEGRIVQDEYYRKQVLDKLVFQLQAPLQTNAVIMPYGSQNTGELQLAGLILENFSELHERIEFGKSLYAILFGVPQVRIGVHAFVRAVHHSGSRADYAPHLYTKHAAVSNEWAPYVQKLTGSRLNKGAAPLYSPELGEAWGDIPVKPVQPGDWFSNVKQVRAFLQTLPLPAVFEITEEHCLNINKIELAVLAAQQLGVSKRKRKK